MYFNGRTKPGLLVKFAQEQGAQETPQWPYQCTKPVLLLLFYTTEISKPRFYSAIYSSRGLLLVSELWLYLGQGLELKFAAPDYCNSAGDLTATCGTSLCVSPGFQAEEFRITKNLENYVDICMNLNWLKFFPISSYDLTQFLELSLNSLP